MILFAVVALAGLLLATLSIVLIIFLTVAFSPVRRRIFFNLVREIFRMPPK